MDGRGAVDRTTSMGEIRKARSGRRDRTQRSLWSQQIEARGRAVQLVVLRTVRGVFGGTPGGLGVARLAVLGSKARLDARHEQRCT